MAGLFGLSNSGGSVFACVWNHCSITKIRTMVRMPPHEAWPCNKPPTSARVTLLRLLSCRLLHLVALTWALSSVAAGDALTDRLDELLSPGSLTAQGDCVTGSSITLHATFSIAFLTKIDADGSLSYRTLKQDSAPLLVEEPVIDIPPEINARITHLTSQSSKFQIGSGEIEGYRINCSAEITANADTKPGQYKVIVALPQITRIAKAIDAFWPSTTPTFNFEVHVYESETALKRAQLEKEAAARSAKAEEAAKLWRNRIRLGVGAATLVCVLLAIRHLKAWLAPKYRLKVRQGGKATAKGSVEKKKPLKKEEIGVSPVDVFSEIVTARTFFGTKTTVSVNLQAISADRSVNEVTETTYVDGSATSQSVSYEEIVKYQVLITASAAFSTQQGRCLARTGAGTVLIHVN